MSEFQHGLLIAAIGMGLVFVVIIFLWGLMALMMKVTSRQKDKGKQEVVSGDGDAPLVPEMQTAEGQRRAAAAAVAVAMVIAGSKTHQVKNSAQEQGSDLNPWDAFHRAHQLQQKNTRG